jgi:hypothetical protein
LGIGVGAATAYVQQETILRAAGVQTPKPKKYAMEAITGFVTKCMEAGDEIVLSLDENDTIDGHANDFSKMVAETGLANILA